MDRGRSGERHLHRRAGLGRLQTFDDQAVTRSQAGGHEPLIAHGPRRGQHPRLDVAGGIDDQRRGAALLVARDRRLRGEDPSGIDTFVDSGANVEAGQQQALGIGENGAQRHRPGGLVHRDFGELQAALEGIGRAVLEDQANLGGGRAALVDPPGLHRLAQRQDLRRRLGHVDVDRVEPLDRGQCAGLARRHQRAFGERRALHAPGDRRRDAGVAEVDRRRLHRRLVLLHRGRRLFRARVGVIEILAADGVDLDEVGVPFGLVPGGCEVRLGIGLLGLRLVQGGPVRGGIDLEEQLSLADVATFHEGPGDDDSVHLRTDVGGLEGGGAAGKLAGQFHRRRRHRDHPHRGRTTLGRPAVFAARRHRQHRRQGQAHAGGDRHRPRLHPTTPTRTAWRHRRQARYRDRARLQAAGRN